MPARLIQKCPVDNSTCDAEKEFNGCKHNQTWPPACVIMFAKNKEHGNAGKVEAWAASFGGKGTQ